MRQERHDLITDAATRPKRRGLWRDLFRSKDGAAAIEFALLAIPYFVVIFAILETFIAFTGEQLVSNAVDTMARKLRTGNITYNLSRPATDMDRSKFRQAFCNEVSILIQCSADEVATPNKLWLDVRSFTSFSAIPTTVPRTGNSTYGELNTATFGFSPGGPKTINMLRAYYKWDTVTDLIRPYITNVRPADGSRPNYFLIVETATFQNEDYP
ncbi:TadE/TadG family type IV pilus assembly protein [Neorhizobium alkalisoli]|uniref:Flp pilus assembly protein TadG n=1 Tax=Neorhizobium alkalisoli TaxID=528178 RepID=A0A561QRK1_9HYPH|nr:TadE/TadG family type IV pilus assembly protein [Neorhizobium alkalisoli]TWF52932.1 Flp pilus assembly protein TadG [Neorhizobium alkalisoli]